MTGAGGFIGGAISKRLQDYQAIPHQAIDTTTIEPYQRFFFCSTYGNMAFHNDDAMVIKANVTDVANIFNQTDLEKGFDSFVYISSSSVKRPVQTMYSRAKKMGEELMLAYMEKYQLPICAIRPYSVTGVGEQKEHLIPKLIDSCLNGTKMDFVPQPRHDFIDVEDLVDGIMTLSDRHARGIFELGSGISHSNQDVLELVEEITEKKANLNIVHAMRSYDTKEEDWVSTNLRARDFGWKPKKSLALSIVEMVHDARRSKTN